MEILSLNNKHIKKGTGSLGYGCVCPNCGTAFIFDDKDISRPRTPYPYPKDCKVICPNTSCHTTLTMDDKCIHTFENSDEKYEFKHAVNVLLMMHDIMLEQEYI